MSMREISLDYPELKEQKKKVDEPSKTGEWHSRTDSSSPESTRLVEEGAQGSLKIEVVFTRKRPSLYMPSERRSKSDLCEGEQQKSNIYKTKYTIGLVIPEIAEKAKKRVSFSPDTYLDPLNRTLPLYPLKVEKSPFGKNNPMFQPHLIFKQRSSTGEAETVTI
jgi:hypothetical protein